jgi:Zn-dependent protease with chaperone function
MTDDNRSDQATAPRFRPSVAGISPTRYQHPLDRQTLATLRESAGLEDLIRWFSQNYHERYARLANVAGRVRIDTKQVPDLHALFRGCCARLGVRPEPEFYIEPGFNAWTSGVQNPYVMLGGATVSILTTPELEFVMGHELGHIRYRHVLYHQMAAWAPGLAGKVPLIGGLLGKGLELALFEWSRAAEYSADRAGLLACQDVDAVVKAMMKLSGMPFAYYSQMDPAAFIEQAQGLDALDEDWMGYLVRTLSEADMTHPWTVLRAAEIRRWHDCDEYTSLLAEGTSTEACVAETELFLPSPPGYRCPICRDAVPAIDRFCSHCGSPVGDVNRIRHCPNCEIESEPGSQFCQQCRYEFK